MSIGKKNKKLSLQGFLFAFGSIHMVIAIFLYFNKTNMIKSIWNFVKILDERRISLIYDAFLPLYFALGLLIFSIATLKLIKKSKKKKLAKSNDTH